MANFMTGVSYCIGSSGLPLLVHRTSLRVLGKIMLFCRQIWKCNSICIQYLIWRFFPLTIIGIFLDCNKKPVMKYGDVIAFDMEDILSFMIKWIF